jgi:tRNA threonylcarbamoyladenosine biosynthesis protein TsaE
MMSGVHHEIVGTPEPHGTGSWLWTQENQTQAFAQCMAQQSGLHNAYLELEGNLGAGKTTLVRHLLQALGVKGRIKSPTYAVVEPHEALNEKDSLRFPIWHFDFYRFNEPEEFEEAGFRDIFASQGLKISEWAQQAEGMLPLPDLKLKITVNEIDGRKVEASAFTPQGLSILQALQAAIPCNSQMTTGHAHSAP